MKEILPVIMNKSFERLAVVDDYISLIWTSRYYTAGDFEICVDANTTNMSLFQKDFYIVRDDDENVGIIEKVVIQHNEDGHDVMIVSGRFLASILARRIIADQTTVYGRISACVESLINQNIIAPSIADRKIANFTVAPVSIGQTMQAQYTGKNLLESISDICETHGIGFKVTLNSNHQFVFTLYEGVDRTYGQTENPWVIFSDQYDNLLSSEYEENYTNVATAVLVAGEGEGTARTTTWVTDGTTGLDRHEVYADQRQIRSNNGGISQAEYMQMLQNAGQERLTKYTAAFTGTVYFDSVKYKQDVNLGDLCVIENTKWGIYINSRLVEVIESVSETGEYSIVPTFGI